MPSPTSIFFPAPDGLQLHALDAGPRDSGRLPVVCLHGLARTVEDFRELIEALAFGAAPRRVLALDLRGRGRSARDPNPDNYSVAVELGDVLALLDAFAVERAVFVGTSRGGILTMAMALARPQAVAGGVLNDVGPVIEMAGILRIKDYVGRMPKPADYAEAAALLRGVMGSQFPAFGPADWERYARRTWQNSEQGGLELRYDPALSRVLAGVNAAEPLPVLWPQFDALGHAPVMVIRGEHSDLLSSATVAEMRARRPDLSMLEIAGQGHAPVLTDERTIGPIARFVEECDRVLAR
ncbi:MAG: alpha/beta hydrolase [Bradyrhizobiaceae bacterium]|nr:alpha/beta hydrolase [Bradyrhizobiaceae bacterium]